MAGNASRLTTALTIAVAVVIGGFTVAFSTLIYQAVLVASAAPDLGLFMTSWTYVTIEVLFLCGVFYMGYNLFKIAGKRTNDSGIGSVR